MEKKLSNTYTIKGKVIRVDFSNKTVEIYYIQNGFFTFNVMDTIYLSFDRKHRNRLISLEKSNKWAEFEVSEGNVLENIL